MNKICSSIILKDYNNFVKRAKYLTDNNRFEDALKFVDAAVRIAYNFNFVYSDNDLEELLGRISEKTLGISDVIPVKDRIVFYDYFGNTKVLTQQYLRAMISWGVEILYIFENSSEAKFNSEIIKELNEYPKATVVILEGSNHFIKMKQAKAAILLFAPSKAFLHIAPWDTIAVCVWNTFPGVDRYFINLTDHAFWLGKSCSDHILEFRNYGYNLSFQARGIEKDKLLLQPYYPIQNESKFEGFPLDLTGKIIGFSGSSFYKIYGRNGKFLQMIKRVIDENENFVFLLAGWGIDLPLRKFIRDNNLESRFVLIGERKDISQVFAHIDIFINTYPFIGGLMTQLAVVNKKPIISYTTEDLAFNYIEEFLTVDSDKAGSIKDENVFYSKIKKLIESDCERKENIESYTNSIPTPEKFNDLLWRNCHDEAPISSIDEIVIDFEAVQTLYLEVENNFLRLYHKLKMVSLGRLYFVHFPLSAIKCTLNIICNDSKTIKKYFLKVIKFKD